MPLHESVVELFRDHPELGPELLRECLQQKLPAYDDIRSVDANLPELVPAEFRVDQLQLLRRGSTWIFRRRVRCGL